MPVERSHRIVEARWVVMPTAATAPASASDKWATSSTKRAISVASNSTRPANGELGANSR